MLILIPAFGALTLAGLINGFKSVVIGLGKRRLGGECEQGKQAKQHSFHGPLHRKFIYLYRIDATKRRRCQGSIAA
jgi:hypothetical protein